MAETALSDDDFFAFVPTIDDAAFFADEKPAIPKAPKEQPTNLEPVGGVELPEDNPVPIMPNDRRDPSFSQDILQGPAVSVMAGGATDPMGMAGASIIDRASNVARVTGRALQNVPENLQTGLGGMQRLLGEGMQDNVMESVEALDQYATGKTEVMNAIFSTQFVRWAKDAGFGSEAQARGINEFTREVWPTLSDEEKAQFAQYINEPGVELNQAGVDRIEEASATTIPTGAEEGTLEYYISSAVGSTAEMSPALLASIFARSPTPVMAYMSAYSGGRAYESARAEDLSPEDARAYATLTAISEGIGEAVPVGVIMRGTGGIFKRVIEGAAAEAVQESVTEALQIGLDMGYITDDMTWAEARQRIMDAGIIGSISGPIMSGGMSAIQKAGASLQGIMSQSPTLEQRLSLEAAPRISDATIRLNDKLRERGLPQIAPAGFPIDATVDTTSPTAPAENNTAVGYSTQFEFDMGPKRPNAPNQPVLDVIGQTAQDVLGEGASVRITSGQEGDLPQYGSNRHQTGNAADVQFIRPDGSVVRATDPEMVELARVAASHGAQGIGFGSEYMGGNHIHIDMVTPGAGQANTWGSGGTGMRAEIVEIINGRPVGAPLPSASPRRPTNVSAPRGTPNAPVNGSSPDAASGEDSVQTVEPAAGSNESTLPDVKKTELQAVTALDEAMSANEALTLEEARDFYKAFDEPASQAVAAEAQRRIDAAATNAPAIAPEKTTPVEVQTELVKEIEAKPTQAQIEAGNYKKAHIKIEGLDITIENAEGSIRTGMDENGEIWSVDMPANYGYIKRTEGNDGDHVDIYVGKLEEYSSVFVVDQINEKTGAFDEHKAITGVANIQDAEALYRAGFSDSKNRLGNITEMSMPDFKSWLRDGSQKKPVQRITQRSSVGADAARIAKKHRFSSPYDLNRAIKSAAKKHGVTVKEMAERVEFAAKKQSERSVRSDDPLIVRSKTRRNFTAKKKAEWQSNEDAITKKKAAKLSRDKAIKDKEAGIKQAVRENLLEAARIARGMGLTVTSSKGRDGKVSSYYVQVGPSKVRISDHVLPVSPRREFYTDIYGDRAEFIVDENTEKQEVEVWLNSLLVELAKQDQSVSAPVAAPVTLEGMYHGAKEAFDFADFDVTRGAQRFGESAGIFLTSRRGLAVEFAMNGKSPKVTKVDVSFKNPMEVREPNDSPDTYWLRNSEKITQQVKDGKHDAVIITGENAEIMAIAFSVDQITDIEDASGGKKIAPAVKPKPKSVVKTLSINMHGEAQKAEAGEFIAGTSTADFARSNGLSFTDTQGITRLGDFTTNGAWMLLNSKIEGITLARAAKALERKLPDPDGSLKRLLGDVPAKIENATEIRWKMITSSVLGTDRQYAVGLSESNVVAIPADTYGYLVNKKGYVLAAVSSSLVGVYEDGKRIGILMPANLFKLNKELELGGEDIVAYLEGFETAALGPVKSGKPAKFSKPPKKSSERLSMEHEAQVDALREEAISRLKLAEQELFRKMKNDDKSLVEITLTKPSGNKVKFSLQPTAEGIKAAKRLQAKWKTTPSATLYLETPDISDLAFDTPMPNHQPMWRSQPPVARPASGKIKVGGKTVKLERETSPTRAESIRYKVQRLIGAKLYQGKIKGKTRAGFYRHRNSEIRVDKFDDVEVIAHELAHWLDFHKPLNGVFNSLRRTVKGSARLQMRNLSYTSVQKNVSVEGFAEFLRLWLTQGAVAKKYAPDFTIIFESELARSPKTANALYELRDEMHKYFYQGPMATARSKIGKDESLAVARDKWLQTRPVERFRQQSIDKLHGIKVAEREITGTISSAERSPYKMMQMVNGWESMYEAIVRYGTLRMNSSRNGYEFNGKSLSAIFKPVYKNFDDFLMYAAGRRASELMSQNRENLFIGVEIAEMLALETPVFKTAFAEYQQFNKEMLDFYVDMDLITPEQRKDFGDMNKNYIPFHRINETLDTGKDPVGSSLGSRLRGGDRNIRDLGNNIVDGLASNIRQALMSHAKSMTYQMIDKNQGGSAFAVRLPSDSALIKDQLEAMADKVAMTMAKLGLGISKSGMIMSMGSETDGIIYDVEEIKSVLKKNPDLLMVWQHGVEPTTKGTFVDTVVINGERRYFEVTNPLFADSMQSLAMQRQNAWIMFAMWVRRLQTRLITNLPKFFVPNIVRDTLTAAVQSDSKFRPFVDSFKGLSDVVLHGDVYQEWKLNGGGYSNLVQNITASSRSRSRLDLPANSAMDYAAKLLAGYDSIAAAFESATRLGEYDRALKMGITPMEAAFRSREVSTDFAKEPGNRAWANLLAVTPFAKAALNGNDRTFKTFIGDDGRIKKGVGRRVLIKLALSWGAGMSLFTIALWMINNDDERYKGLTTDQKTRFWHVWIGDRHVQIPKPYGMGFVFADVVENTLDFAKDQNGDAFAENLAWSFQHHFYFMDFPGLFQPIIENEMTNEKFTGAPVVGPALEDVPPQYQYTDRTPEIYREIGEALNISPLKAENLTRGYLGYLEGMIVDSTELMLWNQEEWGDRPFPATLGDQLFHQFNPPEISYRTKYTEGFYDLRARAQGAQAAMRMLVSQAVRDPNKPLAFSESEVNQSLIALNNGFSRISLELADIPNAVLAIKYDANLSREEKETQIEQLYFDRNEVLSSFYKDAETMLREIEQEVGQ